MLGGCALAAWSSKISQGDHITHQPTTPPDAEHFRGSLLRDILPDVSRGNDSLVSPTQGIGYEHVRNIDSV